MTRRFYEAIGFEPIEEFPTMWGNDNPCLLLVKPLKSEA
jgi:ribosomal protein S18 acetylase RimI-like enzyme